MRRAGRRSPFVEEIRAAKQLVRSAESDLAKAKSFAQSREDAWVRLSSVIHESRNLASAWATASPEDRATLLDYWVHDVWIVVERVPGMKRANWKTAVVTLRSTPGAPEYFGLGRQQAEDDSAEPISSSTSESDSTDSLARSATSASGDPIFPNAQAACARTSGASSDRADTSAGTVAVDPLFPSTTAALRFRPRSFARFIGDPPNAAENSDCDMASSSVARVVASLPARTGRAANASTFSARENLLEYGHTS